MTLTIPIRGFHLFDTVAEQPAVSPKESNSSKGDTFLANKMSDLVRN